MKILRTLLLGLLVSSVAVAAIQNQPNTQPSTPIPMDQLGAVAGKQYQGDGLSVITTPDGARLRCAFQRLEGEVTREGLWLSSTADGSSGERFRVVAVDVVRADNFGVQRQSAAATPLFEGDWMQESPLDFHSAVALRFLPQSKTLPAKGAVLVNGQAASFIRPGLTEEYSVSVDGVRQDFIIEQRPEGEGELRVELDVAGAKVEPLLNGARLALDSSGRILAYNRLRVVDARGQELTARLEVTEATRLAVVVDDANAVYPVRIDPTFSDADWISIGGLPGADNTVNAAVFDGSGNLYIGGSFLVVGNVVANRIAKWDGSSWSTLGAGINNGAVNALVMSGSDLYAGGSFTLAGGNTANAIAKWDGSTWSPLSTGMNLPVLALAVSGSDLYAGGSFSTAGGDVIIRIAKWDGSAWSALGLGLNNTVNALAVIGSDLYAGGAFSQSGSTSLLKIAKWNGSAWSALGLGIGGGTSPSVTSLAVSGTDLYAAGTFTIADPASVNNIAKWNGSTWSALGTGLGSTVNSLAASGSDLYVGGSFTTAGGNPASRIAKWDGSTWSALGSGMSGTVAALAVSGTTVAAGGSFTTTPAMRVATWNGTTWTNLGSGLNAQVNAVAVSGSDVYLGGGFTLRNIPAAINIVRWNGSAWSAVGAGLNGGVNALVFSGGNLYAGGSFTTATNTGDTTVTVNRIAKWNGSTWSALDVGVNNTVSALSFSGSDLFAGGAFSTAGPNPAYNIARWNGTVWSAVGEGLNGTVNALTSLGSDIYAAGAFTTATNSGIVAVTTTRIAKWNGSTWSPLSSGLDSTANALAVSGSTLYAGGFFSNAGGVPVGRIAQWNGAAWSVIGSATNNIFVYALAVSGSDLYIGGTFSTVGPVPANNIAKWDGSNWTALGSGMSGTAIPTVYALATSSGNLYVGGSFTKAGDKAAGYVAQVNIGGAAAPGRFSTLTYSPVTGFSCTFLDATIGQAYRIQTSPSLAAGSWTDFTNFTYTAPTVITAPSAGTTNRFVRAITP